MTDCYPPIDPKNPLDPERIKRIMQLGLSYEVRGCEPPEVEQKSGFTRVYFNEEERAIINTFGHIDLPPGVAAMFIDALQRARGN